MFSLIVYIRFAYIRRAFKEISIFYCSTYRLVIWYDVLLFNHIYTIYPCNFVSVGHKHALLDLYWVQRASLPHTLVQPIYMLWKQIKRIQYKKMNRLLMMGYHLLVLNIRGNIFYGNTNKLRASVLVDYAQLKC
jgi:hypothetical protein